MPLLDKEKEMERKRVREKQASQNTDEWHCWIERRQAAHDWLCSDTIVLPYSSLKANSCTARAT